MNQGSFEFVLHLLLFHCKNSLKTEGMFMSKQLTKTEELPERNNQIILPLVDEHANKVT